MSATSVKPVTNMSSRSCSRSTVNSRPGRLSVGTRAWLRPKHPRFEMIERRLGAMTCPFSSGIRGEPDGVKTRSARRPSAGVRVRARRQLGFLAPHHAASYQPVVLDGPPDDPWSRLGETLRLERWANESRYRTWPRGRPGEVAGRARWPSSESSGKAACRGAAGGLDHWRFGAKLTWQAVRTSDYLEDVVADLDLVSSWVSFDRSDIVVGEVIRHSRKRKGWK
jgi:hypothetical protein